MNRKQSVSHRIALLTLMVSMSLMAGCQPKETGVEANRITPVHVTQPVTGPASPPIVTNGIVTSADEMRLSFKTGGVIAKVHVNEGQTVKAGEVLAELMPAEINAAATQARQMNDKAQRDLARGQRLHDDQVITLEQLQNLKTQADVAAAQLQAAEFNQRWVQITAPAAGVVLRKLAEDREAVAPGQPVLIFGSGQRGHIVKAALADRDLVQLKRGDQAQVTLDALPNAQFSGHITVLGGAASLENGLFPIEVTLDAAPATLVAGMVARVALLPAATKQTLLYVPAGAVVSGVGQRADVFVLDGETARKRPIEVAFLTREQVAVRSGLAATDRVITDGALYLSDGERVSVQKD